jgi:zinc transport system ATP-binding protein
MDHPTISAHGLGLSLGGFTILEGLDFAIPAGAFCAILGPNGGGKSTLLKLLLGLYRPTAGTLSVFGHEPGAHSAALGYVPQVKTLDRNFPALALDLVVSGLRGAWPWRITPGERAQGEAALGEAGAGHLAGRSLAVLSGGELQRVYLARALVRRPRLILLDEPAAGIDAAGEHDMFHVLEAYQRQSGAAVLMVTHDWGAAWHHATLAMLLSRRLLAFGRPETVLTDETLRSAFGHVGHHHGMGWEPVEKSVVRAPGSGVAVSEASSSIGPGHRAPDPGPLLDPEPRTSDTGQERGGND